MTGDGGSQGRRHVGSTGGRVVPPERRYDRLLHAVVEAIHRLGYTPVARRSTEMTSCVLLHGPPASEPVHDRRPYTSGALPARALVRQ